MNRIFAIAALGAAFLATPAAAESRVFAQRTEAVSIADLNLRSAAGLAELDRRIEAAARTACGSPSSADPLGKAKVRRCRAEAIRSASAQRDRAVAAANATASR